MHSYEQHPTKATRSRKGVSSYVRTGTGTAPRHTGLEPFRDETYADVVTLDAITLDQMANAWAREHGDDEFPAVVGTTQGVVWANVTDSLDDPMQAWVLAQHRTDLFGYRQDLRSRVVVVGPMRVGREVEAFAPLGELIDHRVGSPAADVRTPGARHALRTPRARKGEAVALTAVLPSTAVLEPLNARPATTGRTFDPTFTDLARANGITTWTRTALVAYGDRTARRIMVRDHTYRTSHGRGFREVMRPVITEVAWQGFARIARPSVSSTTVRRPSAAEVAYVADVAARRAAVANPAPGDVIGTAWATLQVGVPSVVTVAGGTVTLVRGGTGRTMVTHVSTAGARSSWRARTASSVTLRLATLST